MGKPKAEEQIMALVDFVREEKLTEARARCRVCQLPDAVKDELRDGARRGIERRFQIAYLKRLGYDISNAELTTHRNGGHDG